MAERNKPVKIYIAYSEKDKSSQAARQNIREITAYLTKPNGNGNLYAEILNPLPDPSEKKRRKDVKRKLKSANVVLFLSSDNAEDNTSKKNTIWEIKFAREKGCNIIVCSLDRNSEAKVPGWLNKLDNKAKPLTWEDLKDKTKLHVEKKYKVFQDNKGCPSVEPCAKKIDPRMIEQYQTYMQSIEHQETARQIANNAYININSALLALLGVILDKENLISIQNILFMLIVGVVGLIFHSAWMRTLSYYEQITTAKQRIVNHLERYLPLQLNSTEYYGAMQSPFEKRYKQFKETQLLPDAFRWVWSGLLIAAFLLPFIGPIIGPIIMSVWQKFYPPTIPDSIIKIVS